MAGNAVYILISAWQPRGEFSANWITQSRAVAERKMDQLEASGWESVDWAWANPAAVPDVELVCARSF